MFGRLASHHWCQLSDRFGLTGLWARGPDDPEALPLYWLSVGIPVTYFVEILRGIVLRGADLVDLLPQAIGLTTCCVIVLAVSVARFRKQLT